MRLKTTVILASPAPFRGGGNETMRLAINLGIDMSSLRLKQLVSEVLEANGAHDADNVIEEVFVAIEANPVWRKTYDSSAYLLGKGMAAAWTGFWVAHL